LNRLERLLESTKDGTLPFTSENLKSLNPMNWRYLASMNSQIDRILIRDIDAEIIPREQAAVQQWLESEFTFHVMRDHQFHAEPIMGGSANITQTILTIGGHL
jgi:hypothetical protein